MLWITENTHPLLFEFLLLVSTRSLHLLRSPWYCLSAYQKQLNSFVSRVNDSFLMARLVQYELVHNDLGFYPVSARSRNCHWLLLCFCLFTSQGSLFTLTAPLGLVHSTILNQTGIRPLAISRLAIAVNVDGNHIFTATSALLDAAPPPTVTCNKLFRRVKILPQAY